MHRYHSLITVLFLVAGSALGADAMLPEFTGEWVNGGPYTASGVKEKAVLLYLMERG